MASDIVEKLRREARIDESEMGFSYPLLNAAADEITRLRSENAELRLKLGNATDYAEDWRARAEAAEAREAELRARVDMATAVLVRNWQSPELGRRVEAEFRDALKGKFDCQLCSDGPCSPACCGEKGGA